jgi:hypothetical protein
MLLQKINARTWGYAVVIICASFLVYYSFEIQYSWWAAQPVVASTGLILQQVLVGIIGFIIIPALLWTPVTSEELVEQVRQAHLVKRYELQAQADIAILRNTMLRAQEKALVGFANLTADEREELAGVMQGLVSSIDNTLQEIGHSVKSVSNATIPFKTLQDNDDIRDYLEYIHESLTDNAFARTRQVSSNPDAAQPLSLSQPSEDLIALSDEAAQAAQMSQDRRDIARMRAADQRQRRGYDDEGYR